MRAICILQHMKPSEQFHEANLIIPVPQTELRRKDAASVYGFTIGDPVEGRHEILAQVCQTLKLVPSHQSTFFSP